MTFRTDGRGGPLPAVGAVARSSSRKPWCCEAGRKGYASQVLTGLEDAARAAGYSTLLLETGPLQPEATALYTGRGYHRISYYGRYPDALAFRFDLHSPASPWPASETRTP